MLNNQPALQTVIALLAQTTETAQMSLILDSLLTDNELNELANRMQIFALLSQGVAQREIASRLGVGIATVSRGAKAYKANDVGSLMPFLKQTKVNKPN